MNNLFLIQIYSIMMLFPATLAYMDFFYYMGMDKRLLRWGAPVLELVVLVLPPLLLYKCDAGDAYGDNTIIYPLYRPMVYALILLCLVVYFYVAWRKKLAHPLLEVFIHCALLLGVAVNILIVVRMRDPLTLFLINVPATLLLVLALVRTHRLLLYTLEDEYSDVLEPAPWGRPNQGEGLLSKGKAFITRVCWCLLQMRPVVKTLIFVSLSAPVLIPLTKIFLLAGQIH